jgi:hypothetical protein
MTGVVVLPSAQPALLLALVTAAGAAQIGELQARACTLGLVTRLNRGDQGGDERRLHYPQLQF